MKDRVMKSKLAIVIAIALLGFGCASLNKSVMTYNDTWDKDMLVVEANGNQWATSSQVFDYTMLHSCEIMKAKGYKYFMMLTQSTVGGSYNSNFAKGVMVFIAFTNEPTMAQMDEIINTLPKSNIWNNLKKEYYVIDDVIKQLNSSK